MVQTVPSAKSIACTLNTGAPAVVDGVPITTRSPEPLIASVTVVPSFSRRMSAGSIPAPNTSVLCPWVSAIVSWPSPRLNS